MWKITSVSLCLAICAVTLHVQDVIAGSLSLMYRQIDTADPDELAESIMWTASGISLLMCAKTCADPVEPGTKTCQAFLYNTEVSTCNLYDVYANVTGMNNVPWMYYVGRPVTAYNIAISTSAEINGGTKADVFITLTGENGHSSEIQLDNIDTTNFKRNVTAEFLEYIPNIGGLRQVHIRHNNEGSTPSWKLDKIVITDIGSNTTYSLDCYRWLAISKDDQKIERTLFVSNGTCV